MSAYRNPISTVLGTAPVIPVLVIERPEHAVAIAEALVQEGLTVLEVTLRTPDALAAVSAIRKSVPAAVVGVGSVIDATQFTSAVSAGAQLAVSPGSTESLHRAATRCGLAWLPGAQTVSEVLALRELGYRLLQFFPAQAAGSLHFLRSMSGPVADMHFCPTGGVSASNARDFLALPNVRCVGGSWLTPTELVAEHRWDGIRALAEQALALTARVIPASVSA